MINFNPRIDIPNLIPMQSNAPKSKEAQIKEAVLKVIKFQKGESKEVEVVMNFIKNFSNDDVAIMKNLLKDDDWKVRSYALHMYKGIKYHDKDNSALTPIVEQMRISDANLNVREAAAYAIESSK
jgi:hypothetical protein